MSKPKRRFERANCDLPVLYEFVKWNSNGFEGFDKKRSQQAHCVDISVAGIGVNTPIPLTKRLATQLLKGTKKVRLAFQLENDAADMIVFARLIWTGNNKEAKPNRYGFMFIDITQHQYESIQNYIDKTASS